MSSHIHLFLRYFGCFIKTKGYEKDCLHHVCIGPGIQCVQEENRSVKRKRRKRGLGSHRKGHEREVSEAIEKDMNGYAIRVNRQYDKEGRLVVYDSTYASHYIDQPMDSAWMDSVFFAFEEEFAQYFPWVSDGRFGSLFFTDSLLYEDFFHEDFFRKRLELNRHYMEGMMLEMDSVKNQYLLRKQSGNDRQEASLHF